MSILDTAIEAAVPTDGTPPNRGLTQQFLKDLRGVELDVVNPSSPYAWDVGADPIIRITGLDHDLTINVSGGEDGQAATVAIVQDGTGGRTVTFGTGFGPTAPWAGGAATEANIFGFRQSAGSLFRVSGAGAAASMAVYSATSGSASPTAPQAINYLLFTGDLTGDLTATMPAASSNTGKTFWASRSGGGQFAVILTPVDGSSDRRLRKGEMMVLVSDGTAWKAIEERRGPAQVRETSTPVELTFTAHSGRWTTLTPTSNIQVNLRDDYPTNTNFLVALEPHTAPRQLTFANSAPTLDGATINAAANPVTVPANTPYLLMLYVTSNSDGGSAVVQVVDVTGGAGGGGQLTHTTSTTLSASAIAGAALLSEGAAGPVTLTLDASSIAGQSGAIIKGDQDIIVTCAASVAYVVPGLDPATESLTGDFDCLGWMSWQCLGDYSGTLVYLIFGETSIPLSDPISLTQDVTGILPEAHGGTGTSTVAANATVAAISATASAALPKAGGTMTGAIAMGGQDITGIGRTVATTRVGNGAVLAMPATLAATHNEQFRAISNAGTLTVPAASTLAPNSGESFLFLFVATGGDVVIDGPGATNVTVRNGYYGVVTTYNGGGIRAAEGAQSSLIS